MKLFPGTGQKVKINLNINEVVLCLSSHQCGESQLVFSQGCFFGRLAYIEPFGINKLDLVHTKKAQEVAHVDCLAVQWRTRIHPASSCENKDLLAGEVEIEIWRTPVLGRLTSSVSVVSDFVANGYQTMQHVSTSPPAIPDGQISRVRF